MTDTFSSSAASAAWRMSRSRSASNSVAYTRPEGPTSRANATVSCPLPAPMSATVCPSWSFSAVTRRAASDAKSS